MCIMGPQEIKEDIYSVMTNSRELTNYCQESVRSEHSKRISDALNNYHLKSSIEFLTKTLINDDRSFIESSEMDLQSTIELENKSIYNKVIDYIQSYLIEFTL